MGDILAGLIDIERGSASGENVDAAALRSAPHGDPERRAAAGPSPAVEPRLRAAARPRRATPSRAVIDQLAMEGYLDVAQGRRPTVAAAEDKAYC